MTERSNDVGTIRRANGLMRLLATAGKRGLALTEISAKSRLAHGTVHRLLKQLSDEGLIIQDTETRKYYLGPVTYELGLAAAPIFDLRPVSRPTLEKISRETEDTVYLVMRSGLDAVCIDRVEGTYPIRTITLEIGSRRPLGVGAGGLAILSACETAECERILSGTSSHLSTYLGLNEEGLREEIEKTKKQGYSFIRNRVTLGVTAIGVAFKDSSRRPIGALSVGAIDSRMAEPRRTDIVKILQEQVRLVEKMIREKGSKYFFN